VKFLRYLSLLAAVRVCPAFSLTGDVPAHVVTGIAAAPLSSPPVRILSTDDASYVVVDKPPSVACHRSDYIGRGTLDRPEPVPVLQRVRDAVGRRVNLVHRLDRGASGCLIFALANKEGDDATARLAVALADERSVKTYVALVRGGTALRGEELRDRGWFTIDRPIKNQHGEERDAATRFRFVAGIDDGKTRASIVLCRPRTGRWHQIRKHLNGLSHPILGDSTHGNSATNREWRARGMPGQRLCLHLARIQLPATDVTPGGLDVRCELPEDICSIIRDNLPEVFEDAKGVLAEEGILVGNV